METQLNDILDIALYAIGYLFIWIAVDIGRNKESKIKLFTGNWWLILVLMLIAVGIIKAA